MTTYTVTNATDTSSANQGTLEYALTHAQNNDTILFQTGGTFTLPMNFALPAGTLTLDVMDQQVKIKGGVLTDSSGGTASVVVINSLNQEFSGDGSLILSSANTYTGSTTVGGTGSTSVTLQGGAADAFGIDSAVSLFGKESEAFSTALDLGGYDQHIGSLTSAPGSFVDAEQVTNSGMGPATLHTGADNTSTTFSGRIDDGSTAGTTALDKTGTGTFTLLRANQTYTGGTTLNGGTLELGARGAAGQTQTNSQIAGGVAFAARNTTLQIDSAALTPPTTQTPPDTGNEPQFRVLAATPPAATTTQGSYAGPVTNFATGETLDLSGLTYAPGTTTATYDPTAHTLTVTDGTITDTLTDFRLNEDLPAGSYSFATAQDANTTRGTDVTLVLNAPAAPALAPGQDTGTSSTDGLTDINRPRFTGTGATPNATITLYDGTGATPVGTGASDANGNYTATVTATLADGPHSITAVATTAGGNVSARSAADAITVDATPPAASSVADTVPQGSGPTPIGLAAPSDNISPAGNLAIAAVTLPDDGTVTLADGTRVGAGQPLTPAQLTGLLFTPTGAAGARSAFTYSVTDGAGNASQGTATLTVGAPNTPPAMTPPATTPPAAMPPATTPPSQAPDAVSFDDQVYYDQGFLVVSGRASSAAGVSKVEITATLENGKVRDLGAAPVKADGTFSFRDRVGARTQGFITATETDKAGGTASAVADFSLQGGIGGGYKAEQDRYNADGTFVTATDLYEESGAQNATLNTGGLTFFSDIRDVFENGGQPGTTFVFGTGYKGDVVDLFRPDNVDHDTLSFLGSSFNNDIADVLAHTTQNKNGDAVIHDPGTRGDSVTLIGVSRQQFAANAQQDVTFHA